jgi:hypothetical protein
MAHRAANDSRARAQSNRTALKPIASSAKAVAQPGHCFFSAGNSTSAESCKAPRHASLIRYASFSLAIKLFILTQRTTEDTKDTEFLMVW